MAVPCASWVMAQVCKAWQYGLIRLRLSRLQLEDSDTHFKTNLKAGGVMDVIEKVGGCKQAAARQGGKLGC